MADPKKPRLFPFEGEQLSISQIRTQFYPSVSNGTLYSRIVASGATSKLEYMAYMSGSRKVAAAPEKRFNRQVLHKVESIVKERGCSYCQRMFPVHRLRVASFKKSICDGCRLQRTASLSAIKSTNSGDNNP
jgi:hypothetical protein